MYMKVILHLFLLIIHNALCLTREYGAWSKIETDINQWYERIQLENLSFLNASIFEENLMSVYTFYFQIAKSSIPTLPPNAFRNCSAMRGVFLSDLNINTILPGAFNGTEQLIEIDVSKNKLTKVEDGVFNEVENLEYLDLSNNYIKNVSEQSLTGLQKLNYLYLQGNQISFLYNNLFESQVKSLLKLDLSSNRLREINQTLKGLSHLTHLFLKMNNLSDVARASLKTLTSLLHLDISQTNIQHMQDLGFEKLNNLSLQNNKISFLDRNSFNSEKKSLIVLNISSNSLKEINTVFQGMSHLTHLYLQVNYISSLASNSFQNLSSLQHLDLSHNAIRDLHEYIFKGCEAITQLYLQNNRITFLDFNLFDSQRHSLITLNLSSNNLKEINRAFSGMSHLTSLYLQENHISSTAASSFQDLNSLEYLDISHNDLERFQFGLLDHLDSLIYLNFSSNKFQEFPFMYLSYLTYLKELIFDHNKIKSLNETEMILHFPLLQKIGFSGNFNWSCIRLVSLVKKLRNKNVEVLKGNYFKAGNVRGMACYEDDFVPSSQSELCNDEINPKYGDKTIKDLTNVILEKHDNGTFITILITTSTIALVAMAALQFFFAIKLKRNTHKEHVELL